MESGFDLEAWKASLGLDTENVKVVMRFTVRILEEPINAFLRQLEEIYGILEELVYFDREKPSSAPLVFEGEERFTFESTFVAVYQGNSAVLAELATVLETRRANDAKAFTAFLVGALEKRVDIDIDILGRLLERALALTRWLEAAEGVAELIVEARSASVELLSRF